MIEDAAVDVGGSGASPEGGHAGALEEPTAMQVALGPLTYDS